MEERERGRGSERWRDAGMMDGWRGGGREKGEGEKETAEARAGETRGGERRQPVKQNIPQSDQTGDSFCLTGAVSLSCGYPPGGAVTPSRPRRFHGGGPLVRPILFVYCFGLLFLMIWACLGNW